MFGGSSNVSRDSGSIYGQIYVGDDRVIPADFSSTFSSRLAFFAATTSLGSFVANTKADEVMVASAIFEHKARLRSYEILAGLQGSFG